MPRKLQIMGTFPSGSGGSGANGLSAYEIAQKNGFEGTEQEWLESLKAYSSIMPQDYGAVADGVTDDTTAIQAALDACNAAGGGMVYFPAGVYLLSDAVKFYSNQYLLGESGAVLLQKDGSFNNLMRNYNNGGGLYSVTHDVVIEGLTFDGGTQGVTATTSLAFCHSRNIAVLNCTFRNGYSHKDLENGHDIECNSSYGVKIIDCAFAETRRVGYQSEFVQIDAFYSQAAYPWLPDEGENNNVDNTLSRDVLVRGCRFVGNLQEELLFCNTCVGNHGNLGAENVHIIDNYMENAVYAMFFNKVQNLYIQGNFIKNVTACLELMETDTNSIFSNNILEGEITYVYTEGKAVGFGNVLNGEAYETNSDEDDISTNYIPAPETAVAGQAIVAKTVDSTGKITETETVDLPSGGEGNGDWELFQEITLEEEVTAWTLGANNDTNELAKRKYRELLVECTLVPAATSPSSTMALTVNSIGGSNYCKFLGILSTTATNRYIMHIERTGPKYSKINLGRDGSDGTQHYSAFAKTGGAGAGPYAGPYMVMLHFSFGMAAGSVLRVYGR